MGTNIPAGTKKESILNAYKESMEKGKWAGRKVGKWEGEQRAGSN